VHFDDYTQQIGDRPLPGQALAHTLEAIPLLHFSHKRRNAGGYCWQAGEIGLVHNQRITLKIAGKAEHVRASQIRLTL